MTIEEWIAKEKAHDPQDVEFVKFVGNLSNCCWSEHTIEDFSVYLQYTLKSDGPPEDDPFGGYTLYLGETDVIRFLNEMFPDV